MKKDNNHSLGNIFRPARGARVRKILADGFLGLCVIAVGVGYLGNQLSVCPWSQFTLFFPGWGSLFLIVPAIYMLIRKPLSWFWPICLLGGVLLLLSQQEAYSFSTAAAIVLALFVILAGLRILLSPLFRRARRRHIKRQWAQIVHGDFVFSEVDDGDTAGDTYSVSFGERVVNMSDIFTSATISVSFGEMRFNMDQATVTDCAVIDASCAFGELNIYLPADVRAEVTPRACFGDIQNMHLAPTAPGAPVVYINASCSFGEINIH